MFFALPSIIIYRAQYTKMRKKIIICILLSIAGSASAQNFWITNDDAADNLVWEEKLYRRIEFLADSLCQGRATGTRGGTEAAFWITARFKENGLLPMSGTYVKHLYAGQGLVGHNIIGMMPGSWKNPCDSYIIIGAHYDHLGILGGKMYPGADSNASGTAAMLSLSDMFTTLKKTGRTYGKSIIFVAIDAKEMNMAGSTAFWKMIEDGDLKNPLTGETVTKDKISLMVNIDQAGSSLAPLKSGRRDYMIMLGGHTLDKEDLELLYMCNRFYGTHIELSETYYGSEDFTRVFYGISDHKVFADNGIPAVFFTSGITLNTFKTRDLPETLDMEVLRKRIILIYHWLEKILR